MSDENESGLRRLMAEASGAEYVSYRTLEEARASRDGAVVLEGDDGGQIYAVFPASMVVCNADALERLLRDLDAI